MPDRKVVPEGEQATGQKTILTKEQRAEILRRLSEGEKQAALGREFNVTRAAISLLKQRTEHPERYAVKHGLKKLLTAKEMAEFKHALGTTLPKDHGVDVYGPSPSRLWTMQRGYALADKLFGKKPSVRVMKECLGDHLIRRPDNYLTPPEPPRPLDIRRLSPEMAADKDFVKYCRSPIAMQIEQREYELALEHYHKQLAAAAQRQAATANADMHQAEWEDAAWEDGWSPPAVPSSQSDMPPAPVPGRRLGKHAKSKGNPFTKPKRKKKKR
jgi:hypothetical protein